MSLSPLPKPILVTAIIPTEFDLYLDHQEPFYFDFHCSRKHMPLATVARDVSELPWDATVTSTNRPPCFPYFQVWSGGVVPQGFSLLQPCEKLLQNLFYFTYEHARSHWQMSDIKQKFCPKQSTGCSTLHVACHSLWLSRYSCPASIFFSLPAVHNYAPLGAQQDRACVASSF